MENTVVNPKSSSPLVLSRKLVTSFNYRKYPTFNHYDLNSLTSLPKYSVTTRSLQDKPALSIFANKRKENGEIKFRRRNAKSLLCNEEGESSIGSIEHLLMLWDKGSNSSRKGILLSFINAYGNVSVQELDYILQGGASLLLSRLLSWLRLTYSFGFAVPLQLKALFILLKTKPSCNTLIPEFIENGGVQTLLEIASRQESKSEESVLISISILSSISQGSSLVKTLFCESDGITVISDIVRTTQDETIHEESSKLISELCIDNLSYIQEIRYSLMELLTSGNPIAQLSISRLLSKLIESNENTIFLNPDIEDESSTIKESSFDQETEKARSREFASYANCLAFLNTVPHLFSQLHEDVQKAGIKLMLQLANKKGCFQEVVKLVVTLLQQDFQTKKELNITNSNHIHNEKGNSIHLCAIRVIRGLCDKDDEEASLKFFLKTQVCEGLVKCLLNIHSYETQKEAIHACSILSKMSSEFHNSLVGILGREFSQQILELDKKAFGKFIGDFMKADAHIREVISILSSRGWNMTVNHSKDEKTQSTDQKNKSDMIDGELNNKDSMHSHNETDSTQGTTLDQDNGQSGQPNQDNDLDNTNVERSLNQETCTEGQDMTSGNYSVVSSSFTLKRNDKKSIVYEIPQNHCSRKTSSLKIRPHERNSIVYTQESSIRGTRRTGRSSFTHKQDSQSFKVSKFVNTRKYKGGIDKVSNALYADFENDDITSSICLSQRAALNHGPEQEPHIQSDSSALEFVKDQWTNLRTTRKDKMQQQKLNTTNRIISRSVETIKALPNSFRINTGIAEAGLVNNKNKMATQNVQAKNEKQSSQNAAAKNNHLFRNGTTIPSIENFTNEALVKLAILHAKRPSDE